MLSWYFACLKVSITVSNGSWSSPSFFWTPSTTSPYIWMKRR